MVTLLLDFSDVTMAPIEWSMRLTGHTSQNTFVCVTCGHLKHVYQFRLELVTLMELKPIKLQNKMQKQGANITSNAIC